MADHSTPTHYSTCPGDGLLAGDSTRFGALDDNNSIGLRDVPVDQGEDDRERQGCMEVLEASRIGSASFNLAYHAVAAIQIM